MTNGNVNAIGQTKDASARSYYERGKELFFRNNLPDLTRAIESFRTAVEIDPNYAQAYAMLASALIQSATEPNGRWLEEAESAATTALRIAPMLPEAQIAHGGNLWHHGRARASIEPFLTAYELDPRSARTAATIGNIYDIVGRPDLALPWFEKATRREARPVYADNIGDAWANLGDYDKAEKAYKIAEVFRPDLPVAALGFSRLALFKGDYENARKQCEAARVKYKDNPQPLIMAAQVEFFTVTFTAAESSIAKRWNQIV